MARKLYISGTNGTMMISNGEVNDEYVSQNPIPFRNLLYFHSGLPYIQIKQKISAGNITFADQARGITTWADGSHGCLGGGC